MIQLKTLFQALFPVLVLFIPCMIFPIAVFYKADLTWLGETIALCVHSTPLFNSLTVMICVPAYHNCLKSVFIQYDTSVTNSSIVAMQRNNTTNTNVRATERS